MNSQYPDYLDWIAFLDKRDQGVMLVAMAALTGLAILGMARWISPELLPATRRWLGYCYFASFIILLVWTLVK